MAKVIDGWVHNFTVNETRKHRKGYTIYKITSIVFPRFIPEALSCITVWKRYSEIKQLYKAIVQKHKELRMTGSVPDIKEEKIFIKRFDKDVIERRRQYILLLLDYIAEHIALYTSESFIKFLRGGHTPNISPSHNGNIATICSNLDIPLQSEIALIDPSRDSEGDSNEVIQDDLSTSIDCIDSASLAPSLDTLNSIQTNSDYSRQSSTLTESTIREQLFDGKRISLEFQISQDVDYFFDAAVEFSKAMENEVNCNYQEAFDQYQKGIDMLLTGAKNDTDVQRKNIAKEKCRKYLTRSEDIYETYILRKDEIDNFDSHALEKPISHLSKYKVVKIIDTVMQVQDVTDKKFYIMKAIEKQPSSINLLRAIFLPHDVPYMVPLVAFFQSEFSIYLLLRQACGGKLWDYIKTYKPIENNTMNEIDEARDVNFMIPLEQTNKLMPSVSNKSCDSEVSILSGTGYDSGFVELLSFKSDEISINENPIKDSKDKTNSTSSSDHPIAADDNFIPSFDILSKDMDVLDLVSCSQKLLKSVTNTLEQSKVILDDDNENDGNSIDKSKKSNQMMNHFKTEDKIVPEMKIVYNCLITNSDNINEEYNNMAAAVSFAETNVSENQLTEEINPKVIKLPEGCIRQWASELVVAVDSLHSHKIICCDLRPENLLLGPNGQLLLTYFYFRNVHDYQLSRKGLKNLYVAPERPLCESSDWWSVGVLLFELLTRTDFIVCHPDCISTYYEIQYPEGIEISIEARNLLDGLLQLNPQDRFGIDEIKTHAFFKGTNWDELKTIGKSICF